MQGVVGSLITTSLQIYCRVFRSSGEKKIRKSVKILQIYGHEFCLKFFWPTLYVHRVSETIQFVSFALL